MVYCCWNRTWDEVKEVMFNVVIMARHVSSQLRLSLVWQPLNSKEKSGIRPWKIWLEVGIRVEFNWRRIFVIVHRSARFKLAVDSLVFRVCWPSFIPPKNEKEYLANCFQSKIQWINSFLAKLSRYLYIHSYTHLVATSVLHECLLFHNFLKSCSTDCHWSEHANAKEYQGMTVQYASQNQLKRSLWGCMTSS